MPFPRPVDAALHGVVDYTAGTFLLTAFPRLAGIEGTQSAKQVRISAAVHAGYSTITNYPLGIVKVLPYQAHLALDAIGAVALAATPFVTGQYRQGPDEWAPHVALCLFELAWLALSDPPGRGDYKADVAAVRAANTEARQRKIHDGRPAVTPGSARNG